MVRHIGPEMIVTEEEFYTHRSLETQGIACPGHAWPYRETTGLIRRQRGLRTFAGIFVGRNG